MCHHYKSEQSMDTLKRGRDRMGFTRRISTKALAKGRHTDVKQSNERKAKKKANEQRWLFPMKWVCTMGCGQSKSVSKTTGDDPDSNDVYHKSTKVNETEKLSVIPTDNRNKDNVSHTNGGFQERNSGKENLEVAGKPRALSGPLQPHISNNLCTPGMPSKQVTASQLEFFKMLDEKIEKGRELTPEEEVPRS